MTRFPRPHQRPSPLHDLPELLGFFAVVLVFYWAGFWALVILPTLGSAWLLCLKSENLARAFVPTCGPELPDDERWLVQLPFLILSITFTGAAVVTEGGVHACLAASFFWLLTLYLSRIRMEAANNTKRFLYHLTKGSMELLVILTVALCAFSVFAIYIGTLSAGAATKIQIRSWEDKIGAVHAFLAKANLSALEVICLVGSLYLLRIVEIRFGHGAALVSSAWGIVRPAMKWLNRVAIAATVAASFTFLATRAAGPVAPLDARLKDMEKDYSEFRSSVVKGLEVETKLRLCRRAWKEMPEELRQVLTRAEDIQRRKRKLLDEISRADSRYTLEGTASAKAKKNMRQS